MNRLYDDGQRVSFPFTGIGGLAFGVITRMNVEKSFSELQVLYDVRMDGRDYDITLYETTVKPCCRDLPRAVRELVNL